MENSDRFGLETAVSLTGYDASAGAKKALTEYVGLLRKWQKTHNLVGPQTLSEVWTRHIADSLQLLKCIEGDRALSNANTVPMVDLGSGGGLPGAVLAIATCDKSPRFDVTLIEATARKASFLRTVSRETATPFTVINARIEDTPAFNALFVTARALAPLAKLVQLAKPWLDQGAIAYFHKGGESARELEEWPDASLFNVLTIPSVVDPISCILRVSQKRNR